MRSLTRTAAVALRQFYLIRGSFPRLVPLFAWVAIDIVVWGFMARYLNQVSAAGVDFVPSLLGAVLLWSFFTRVMHGLSMTFFEDLWSRNFLSIFASPIQIPEYLGGLVLSSIATSAIGLTVMLLLSTVAFGLSFFALGAATIPLLLVLFLFGIALGIFSAALVLRLGPAAEWFVWPIPALLSPFAAVFYPLSTLPPWMQSVAKCLPAAYVFEGLRGLVRGEGLAARSLGIALTLTVAYVLMAGLFFWRIHRYVVRTGLLARYSAETVT